MKYIKLFETFQEDEVDFESDELEEFVDEEHMDEETPESDEVEDEVDPGPTKKNLVGGRNVGGRDNLSYMPQTNYS